MEKNRNCLQGSRERGLFSVLMDMQRHRKCRGNGNGPHSTHCPKATHILCCLILLDLYPDPGQHAANAFSGKYHDDESPTATHFGLKLPAAHKGLRPPLKESTLKCRDTCLSLDTKNASNEYVQNVEILSTGFSILYCGTYFVYVNLHINSSNACSGIQMKDSHVVLRQSSSCCEDPNLHSCEFSVDLVDTANLIAGDHIFVEVLGWNEDDIVFELASSNFGLVRTKADV